MSEFDSHTPDHTIEEKEKEIIVVINAPLSKPKEAAFVLEKNVFTFESPPYLLKIKLPHPVFDRFSQQAYDDVTKSYKIKLKKNFGPVENDTDEEDGEILNSTKLPEGDKIEAKDNGIQKQFYGFVNKYSCMFGKLYHEFSEVIHVPNPDYTPVSERRNLRMKEENEKWDEDHYLADTMETNHLESIFEYKPPWITSPLKDDFNKDEKEILAEIMNKSKLSNISERNFKLSELQIVDILFGYAYNKRTTEGDNTVESGWTINKLSSTLCWLEVFEDLKTVLLSCYRRSLIFPLYRNWNLAKMVHKDVADLFKKGPKQVTRALLEVKEIFNESENRYILNSLYVNDLCNFGYHMAEKRCFELATEISNVKITKYEVHNDLPILEIAAHLTLEEVQEGSESKAEMGIEKIVDKIAGLKVQREVSSSSESETSTSTESSDEEED